MSATVFPLSVLAGSGPGFAGLSAGMCRHVQAVSLTGTELYGPHSIAVSGALPAVLAGARFWVL